MLSWANYEQQIPKDKNPASTSEVPGTKAGAAHDPCTRRPPGAGRPPKPSLWPDPPIHSYPHPI